MVDKNPHHLKEITFLDGDAPSSTTSVVGSLSTSRFGTTKLVLEPNQQLGALQQ
jgi:hypothetical protein